MKKAIALVLLFTMALVSVMAGGSNEQAATSADADTIYIACGAPFTGDDAQYGIFFRNALDMKAEEINAAGGILSEFRQYRGLCEIYESRAYRGSYQRIHASCTN